MEQSKGTIDLIHLAPGTGFVVERSKSHIHALKTLAFPSHES